MIGIAICLVAMAVAAFVATRTAKHLPGDFRVWASIGGLLIGVAMLATAANPHYPLAGFIVGIPCLFCMTVGIWREPKVLAVI
jgi:hypothetical protein